MWEVYHDSFWGRRMQETELVMDLMRELSRRDCNGHAKVRLGTALADPDRFHEIFAHYARGTYFEQVDLEIEEIPPAVQCSCGYRAYARTPDHLSVCPRCRNTPQLYQGTEFAILEPEPVDGESA